MRIASLVRFEGYKVSQTIKNLEAGEVLISLEATNESLECKRCGTELQGVQGKHRIRAKFLPIFTYIYL